MDLDDLVKRLPLAGIVAFSLCSTYSLYQLLNRSARHPTPLFWIPSVLVELVTAWAVYQIVEQARRVTLSNILKQDRRFYALILAAYVVVAVPTLAASVWANTLEFGNVILGLLFPVSSIGCAVGVALPDTLSRYERRKREASEEQKAERQRKRAERQRAQEQRQQLATLGKAAETLRLLAANPRQTQATIGEALGITRQAVGKHIERLEKAGAIKRNGAGTVTVVWEV